MSNRINLFILPLIFLSVFTVNAGNPLTTSWDSSWTVHTSASLFKQGNADIDEYVISDRRIRWLQGNWTIKKAGGHYYTIFPLGVSVVAAPFVYIFNNFLDLDIVKDWQQIERLSASCIVAICAMFIYLIAGKFLNKPRSLLVTFIFAFCTSAWSIATRALWQHCPSMLMLTITLYFLILARKKPYLIQFAGLSLAFAYLVRPLNILSAAGLSLYVLIFYRKYFLYYIFWFLLIITPFLFHNLSVYGSLLPSYFVRRTWGIHISIFERLIGNLISPSRGFFTFSPVLLFSLWGVFLKVSRKKLEKFDIFLLAVITLHWTAISLIPYWCGAASFGTRYFSDMVPYFVYFLIPAIPGVTKVAGMARRPASYVFLVFVVVSFFIHYRGATKEETWYWNIEPLDIKYCQERAWNFKDLQFLRGTKTQDYLRSYSAFFNKELKTYKINEQVSIGNNDTLFFAEGWSYPEPIHRWSERNYASLVLKLGDAGNDCAKYQFRLTAKTLMKQEIDIFVNGSFAGKLQFEYKRQSKTMELDSKLLRFNDINTIGLYVPFIKKPGNGDRRILGIALFDFSINKM